MLPFSLTLSVLAGVNSAYSFLSAGSTFAARDTTFLKSLFTFAVPFSRTSAEYTQLNEEFSAFLESFSARFAEVIDTDPVVRVVHGGTYITTYEVYQAV